MTLTQTLRLATPIESAALRARIGREVEARFDRIARTLGVPIAAWVDVEHGGAEAVGLWVDGQRLRWPRELEIRARMAAARRLLSPGEASAGLAPLADPALDDTERVAWVASIAEAALIQRPELLATQALVDQVAASSGAPAALTARVLDAVLGCGVSIESTARLGELIARSRDRSPPARIEQVLDALHPRELALELPRDLLVTWLERDPHRDHQPLGVVHTRARRELGLVLPDIRLVVGDDVPPGCFRIRINALAGLAQPAFPVDHTLSTLPGDATPVFVAARRGPSWLRPCSHGDGELFTALDYVGAELFDAVTRRAARLVRRSDVEAWCDELHEPALVAIARASKYFVDLPRALRALLAERVSIADLPRILDRVVDHHEVHTPPPRSNIVWTRGFPVSDDLPPAPDRLVESIRFVLGGAMLTSIRREGELCVLVLTAAAERQLLDDSSLALRDRFVDSVLAQLDRTPADAVLTNVEIRARVRALCGDALPAVPILSFQELPPSAHVIPVGRIDLGTSPVIAPAVRRPRSRSETIEGLAPFLADAAARLPAVPDLLPELESPPDPSDPLRRARAFAGDATRPADSLKDQGWGIVIPAGARGEALLGAMAALVDHRVHQQGAVKTVYRLPSDLRHAQAGAWVRDTFEATPEHRRPRYLLILGDLTEVSLDVQHALAPLASVGRLAFDREDDYRVYADKAIAADRRARAAIRAAVFVGNDDSRAMAIARSHLVEPCLDALADLAADRVTRIEPAMPVSGTKADLLAAARDADLMFSVTHGAGGEMDYADRREHQGALLTTPGELLVGDDVASGRFLPDGLWLMFACYGAGTPARSTYSSWIGELSRLKRLADGHRAVIEAGQLREGEAPFIAALPRKALANPEGPLAVIGHVDLAWSYGFTHDNQTRFDRLFSAVRALAREQLAGFALEQIVRACVVASDQLAQLYVQRAEHERGVAPALEPRLLARTWMLRQDLRGFILLGDPAVRLRTQTPPP